MTQTFKVLGETLDHEGVIVEVDKEFAHVIQESQKEKTENGLPRDYEQILLQGLDQEFPMSSLMYGPEALSYLKKHIA